MLGAIAATVAVLALSGACARSGTGPDTTATATTEVSAPSGPTQLVLRVTEPPGLLPPGGLAAVLPAYSLFGDGRLVVAPAPGTVEVWPSLRQYQLSAAQVRQVQQSAVQAGLTDAAPAPPAAGGDAPVRIFTVGTGTGPRTTTVPRSDQATTRLYGDLVALATGAATTYQPTAVAIIATANTDPSAPVREWPLASLDGLILSGTSAGSRCTVARDAAVERIRQAAAGATAGTLWRSNGQLWTVVFRPLLPDQPDCSSV
jgi:hypothetical protein